MRKHRGVLGLVAAAVGLGLMAFAAFTPPPMHQINRASLDRVGACRTRAEVEALLGVPPGDYTASRWARARNPWVRAPLSSTGHAVWIADEGWVAVAFTPDGLRTAMVCKRTDPPPL
jgi:hypothetical protein